MKATFLRLLYFGIPALVIALSIAALNAGPILKRPAGTQDNVVAALDQLSDHVTAGRWTEAAAAGAALDGAWQRVRQRVHLVAGESELRFFELSLAELQGAVAARAPAQFQVARRKVLTMWHNLAQ